MIQKIVNILGSVRFWIVTLTAALGILNGSPVVETIQMWLAAVATIGTLDSVAVKLSGRTS